MPFINVKLAAPVSDAQKADIITGVTKVMQEVLGKDPEATLVLVEESPRENWGKGGRTLKERLG